ncbi:acyltransferase [Leifsonia sp. YIM 134122]|uniref:Acyltransferase n=1 Tax=Leifsonia stereocauli TaxID=3134136 RepID=A0ABU9W3I6_9MICO
MHTSGRFPIDNPRGRFASLDGLRGVAAVIVLVHHCFLMIPALAGPYYGNPSAAGALSWLVYSPLHVIWGGTEAVYLFFVLSGLVLGLSVRSRNFSWAGYFPSRLVRLYVPVAAAVVLALVSISLVSRLPVADSAWLNARPDGYTPAGLVQDLTLIGGVSRTISPLWSLQWEMLFSLLLPVYVLMAARAHLWVQLAATAALVTVGAVIGSGILVYLPMFAVGTALAARWDEIGAWCRGLSTATWIVALCAALPAMVSYWLIVPLLPSSLARSVSLPIALAGITALILATAYFEPIRSLLSTAIFRWFGIISFSLYLVHEPLVIASGFLFARPAVAIVIAVPVSIAVAYVFHLAVERPAHRLSRTLRTRYGAAAEPVPVTAPRQDAVS